MAGSSSSAFMRFASFTIEVPVLGSKANLTSESKLFLPSRKLHTMAYEAWTPYAMAGWVDCKRVRVQVACHVPQSCKLALNHKCYVNAYMACSHRSGCQVPCIQRLIIESNYARPDRIWLAFAPWFSRVRQLAEII